LVPLEMSTIDIEAPGADEAALRAAIQALVPISTTTISSPVNYVDITLPSGYSAYHLILTNVGTTSGNNLEAAFVFSQNGGASFLEDFSGSSLAYKSSVFGQNTNTTTLAATVNDASITPWSGRQGVVFADMLIYPGSASKKATLMGRGNNYGFGVFSGRHFFGECQINTARCDAIRIFDWNGSDPNAPDPLYSQFDFGVISLYGVL
jgi:hypothetical protein